jgi:hypothetical protein
MKMYPILISTFALGMLVLGSANADTPLVAPGGGDPLAQIDLSNAGVEEAPIVIAGTPRRRYLPPIPCCNSDDTCQTTIWKRCTIQGGRPTPGGDPCTSGTTPGEPDPVCRPQEPE